MNFQWGGPDIKNRGNMVQLYYLISDRISLLFGTVGFFFQDILRIVGEHNNNDSMIQ